MSQRLGEYRGGQPQPWLVVGSCISNVNEHGMAGDIMDYEALELIEVKSSWRAGIRGSRGDTDKCREDCGSRF